MEMNDARALWFHTSNAAGMAITPLRNYNILSARYEKASGAYKRPQEGDGNGTMSFNTNGALQLGRFFLWGDFTFADNHVTGATYNTNRYDPLSPAMPYYVADPNKSDWKRQYYDMALKVALPLREGRLAAGVEVHYSTKRAAKQLDPRATVHAYEISVQPSIVVKITPRHHAGLSLWYQNAFDRNSFTNSLTYHSESIYIMKGLGNYSPGVVGGTGGIGVFYYPGSQYGGGLQYGLSANDKALLLDITCAKEKTEALETPTKPRRRGTAGNTAIAAKLQLIRNGNHTHKITAEAFRSATDGIEYVQEYDSRYEVNQWITVAEYVKSTYKLFSASLRYDLFTGALHDYSWKAGLKTIYANRQDEYLAPRSVFHAQNSYTEVSAAKNLPLGAASRLLLGGHAGYNVNLGGEYRYTGTDATTLPVTDFYAQELDYFTTHYATIGGSIHWSLLLKSPSSINLHLSGEWIKPATSSSGRLFLKAEAAFIF
jgi:hypothetical protein